MKINTFLTSITAFMLSAAIITYPIISQAKQISLYDQPSQNAKVIGTADLSAGIIPIYTPPNGSEWIKIADPRNGNVGWAKASDIKSTPSTNQIIQVVDKPKTNDEISKEYINKISAEQQEIQKSLQNMFKDVNDLLHHEWKWWGSQNIFPPSNVQPNNAQPTQGTPNQQVSPQPSTTTTNPSTTQPH